MFGGCLTSGDRKRIHSEKGLEPHGMWDHELAMGIPRIVYPVDCQDCGHMRHGSLGPHRDNKGSVCILEEYIITSYCRFGKYLVQVDNGQLFLPCAQSIL